ncbi:M48 family metallopeptidase [Neptuniibacter sp. CAU 1671]|uniref:M48 family metallopeptidase n=1 Tax=Neptuniibacter sp. CAU 1671 TaxID=3032593 RepID=UPI0023DC2B1F|nr:M48 family metallopeptidase [Neptuniibacter sp. CAU 1671]MDF2182785.1 M48 family metallopeptidase [Neptuniibacter sp. CAU 1671]
MRTSLLFLLSLCVFISGCSTAPPLPPMETDAIKREQERQTEAALRHKNQQRMRLQSVAHPLLVGSAARFCASKQRYSLGLMLHQIQSYPELQQKAATAIYGPLQQPTVLHVLPASPAEHYLLPGDALVAINQQPVPTAFSNTLAQLQTASATGKRVSLTINRTGQQHQFELTPRQTCNYPVRFSNSDRVNGFADGKTITLNAGMLRFANDSELALIVAHELAHNVLQHARTELQRITLGGLLDLVMIGSGIPSPGIAMGLAGNLGLETYELQADRLAIDMLSESGYPLEGMAEFWRRLGKEYPQSIHSQGVESHPGTAERYLRMKQQIEKIQTGG